MNSFFYELINHYKSLDIEFNGIFIGYLGNEDNLHN
ncbi:phosphomethylpyrimidine kinase, partial [Clostridium perfringens]|nr:phosphomethylpyrimidine kinase [Clostridium perfringens]